MAIGQVISAGTKTSEFAGQPVMKVGASNTLKLNREALNLLGVDLGGYVFIAPDTEDKAKFYIAAHQTQTNTESGGRGSKLGIVGEKTKNTVGLPQLQFSHASLGSELYEIAAAFEIQATVAGENEGDEPTSASFEHDGLTFFPMTVLQSREEADKEKEANEAAKQKAATKKDDAQGVSSTESTEAAPTGRAARKAATTEA